MESPASLSVETTSAFLKTFDSNFLFLLRKSLSLACDWIMNTALTHTCQHNDDFCSNGIAYPSWKGSLRGEYSARDKQWRTYCPYWHSSQGMKALLLAAPFHLNDKHNIDHSVMEIADFLLRNRITDKNHKDFGLPLAFEDSPRTINTSAILEALDGLFLMSDHTGDSRYESAAIDALRWISNNSYLKGTGLFQNSYNPEQGKFVIIPQYRRVSQEWQTRPLLDDAVFLKAFSRSGIRPFREIFFETADRLLETEYPPGNWIRFLPCNESVGYIHPRHAYWWGMPLLEAWVESDNLLYHDAALRAADWYVRALRKDGGMIRNTYSDFNTDSFGHATSGAACASIFFMRCILNECNPGKYLPFVRRSLEFCMKMQFVNVSDKNLEGAILEKILPPDGTDSSPYHLRDLGSIFFIQAAAFCLDIMNHLSIKKQQLDTELCFASSGNGKNTTSLHPETESEHFTRTSD